MIVIVRTINAGTYSTMDAPQVQSQVAQKVTSSSWSAIVHCCSDVNECHLYMQGVKRKVTETTTQTEPEHYQVSIEFEIEALHQWIVVNINISYAGRHHTRHNKNT